VGGKILLGAATSEDCIDAAGHVFRPRIALAGGGAAGPPPWNLGVGRIEILQIATHFVTDGFSWKLHQKGALKVINSFNLPFAIKIGVVVPITSMDNQIATLSFSLESTGRY
jgi:hypothetical protein